MRFSTRSSIPACLLAALGVLAAVGCGGPQQKTEQPAAHNHPKKGPHDGEIIELGDENYHAELVHDEKAGTVTVYVLDGSAKKVSPIDAKEVVVNLKHDGKPEQFKLAAKPESGETDGKSSRFFSEEKELAEDLDAEGADALLVITLGKRQLRGEIAHSHDKK